MPHLVDEGCGQGNEIEVSNLEGGSAISSHQNSCKCVDENFVFKFLSSQQPNRGLVCSEFRCWFAYFLREISFGG